MATQSNNDWVGLSSFVGGESQDSKFGQKYQYDYARHIDVRSQPAGFSVLPGTSKATGTTVTDLVQDMTQAPDGTRYALGDAGNIYKVNTSGIWSKEGNIGQAGGGGILYRPDADCIYITGQTKISRIKTVSTTPTLQINWFPGGFSTAATCTSSGGTQTYNVPLAISEVSSAERTFITDIEPLTQIGITVINKGTGDWTVTIHDDANNLLGSSTILNANLINVATNYFIFSQIRLQPSINNYTSTSNGGRTYHFHVTSTVADGTVGTSTAGSLSGADMQLYADALIQTRNGLHPIYNFANLTLFGNEKYVAGYAPLQDNPTTADFLRHNLTFPSGYETNGFMQLDLYCGITTEQRSTNVNANFQGGKFFLWDAIQTTYNRYFDIPEGSPEAPFSHKNVGYMIVSGALYETTGGQPVKIRQIRNTDSSYSDVTDSTHVNPHMMTVRRNILLIGYPTITTNPLLEHVVYGYGAVNKNYPLSWTTNYNNSNGTILNNGSNNLRLGMVKNYNDTLYISWRDDQNGGYGVDIVNNLSNPAPDFQLQLLYVDYDVPYREKLAKKALCVFDVFPSGVSVRMWYMLNNDGVKHYSTDDTTPPVTSGYVCTINIPQQYRGLQVGLEGKITGSVSPFFRGVFMLSDLEPDRSEVSEGG